MKVQKINIGETGLFSPLFLDFLNQKEELKQFYSLFPAKENFKNQINEKQQHFASESRNVLVKSLTRQYGGIEIDKKVRQNIDSISQQKTFTITTGHQLNIFTGPLYFIYKIVTVINACKELRETYPDYNFIPVYWMASEDHDYEEISYINLDGKKYAWETEQTGAVGRFDPSSLKNLLDTMPGLNEIYHKAYLGHDSLASAVRYYVNELFGDEGLVVIDGDDHDLKSQFKEIMQRELESQSSSEKVEHDTEKLVELGYKPQITSREINLFYLDKGLRERIILEDDVYRVLNTELSFSRKEILDLLENQPEKFSPNVILRPLYQEVVLPNLAYVGGPAEVIYWLQLKSMFVDCKIPFPILLPRNFVLYVDHVVSRKIEKSGISINALFKPLNKQIEEHMKGSSKNDLELTGAKESVTSLFETVLTKAEQVDTTLKPLVNAETHRAIKSLEKIEKKMVKAEKRHHDDYIRRLEEIKELLFPGGSPQERTLNYLNFQLEDNGFISKIKDTLSPFDLKYHVVINGSK